MTSSPVDQSSLTVAALLEENLRLRERIAALESGERVTTLLLSGLDVASVFLGPDLRLQRFSPGAVKLLGLGQSDVGQPIGRIGALNDQSGLLNDLLQVQRHGKSVATEVPGQAGQHCLRRVMTVSTPESTERSLVISFFDLDAIRLSESHTRQADHELQHRFEERSQQLREESERRIALERELRNQRDFVNAIVDSTNVLIIVTDREHRVVRYNRACELASGMSAEHVLGKSIFDTGQIPESQQAGVRNALNKVLAGEGLMPHTNTWVHADGTARDFEWLNVPMRDESGMATYVVASAVDVTQRNLATKALREERDLLEAVLNVAPAAIVLTDTSGALLRMNQAAQEIIGRGDSELLGKDLAHVIVPEYERPRIAELRRSMAAGNPIQSEFDICRPDGSIRRLSWKAVRLHDSDGMYRYSIGAGLDLTDLLSSQVRERERLNELAQLHRAHTAGELATVLAHEINQPLAAITSYASAGMLAGVPEAGKPSRAPELFEKIADAAVRAGRVVRDLRSFVSRTPGTMGPVEVRTILATSVELVESYAKRHAVTIEQQFTEQLTVLVDAIQVQHIVVNLVRNGVEAIAGAGHASGTVLIAATSDQGMARITVSDTGPGITQDDLTNLYQPFFSTKTEGLGMGFRISRSLAAANGGRIVSELHAPGAIFHVYLPLAR